jgi:hypothetical protein
MEDKLAEQLEERAGQNERSLHGEIIHALDEYVRVPVVGKIHGDGTINIDPRYLDYLSGKDPIDPRD